MLKSKPITTRCRSKRHTFIRTCGPLIIAICIFLLFGFMYWLYFDLRQQIYDHRMRIEQGIEIKFKLIEIKFLLIDFCTVSATSQLLPDALQKWHATTKALEQNQSVINNKIFEIYSSLETIEKEVYNIVLLIF